MKAILLDLPTFPKGILSLSLPCVAQALAAEFEVRIIDLNLHEPEEYQQVIAGLKEIRLFGLKVSSQNHGYAGEITSLIRRLHRNALILWGGEFPTLAPERCLEHADSIVKGRFDSTADAFIKDFREGAVKKIYAGDAESIEPVIPALSLMERRDEYYSFMGEPLETSQGCANKCTFCMVHVMQEKQLCYSEEHITKDLAANRRDFINILDYNLGNDKDHLIKLTRILEKSPSLGWMGEMCIECLDDDQLLRSLERSGCKIIYCGLESLEPASLKMINKTQNRTDHYRRIIRKAQSYGIQIACGYILGIPNASPKGAADFLAFCEETGIIYLKLTYLIYNPGTKVMRAMREYGRYATEDYSYFDGSHVSFIPGGVRADRLNEDAMFLSGGFYSWRSMFFRSRHLKGHFWKRLEFMLFSYLYGRTYKGWLKHGRSEDSNKALAALLKEPVRKSILTRSAEKALRLSRRRQLDAKKEYPRHEPREA